MKSTQLSINYSSQQIASDGVGSLNPHDLVCLSHLRWDFVYQRPHHLLSRFANDRRVFFFEEPVYKSISSMQLDVSRRDDNLYVVTPQLPQSFLHRSDIDVVLGGMIDELFATQNIRDHILWYYTPMAVSWTRHLQPKTVVYDCMDELCAFKGAPSELKDREAELLSRCDLVFTGGQSLFDAKKDRHPNVFSFPSSIDASHFAQARESQDDPADQAGIPHPRLGFFGVIDERMDIELVDRIAEKRPDWHLVLIGPLAKIEEGDLPHRDNIHYLGAKAYKDLPSYLANWDVALLPFARNESTRFISPTKTPEYLAAGKPVVSTSIQDVVRPYGKMKLVRIADSAEDFVAAVESAMTEDHFRRIREVDAFLMHNSWDRTWGRMNELIEDAIKIENVSTVSEPVVLKSLAAGAAV